MIERIQRLSILLLITFRPEFTPPCAGQPYLSALPLTRLGRREGAAMVEQVAQDNALPNEIATQTREIVAALKVRLHLTSAARSPVTAPVRGGASQRATAKALRVHKNTVRLWLTWLREGGAGALKPKRRGRAGTKQVRMIEMLKRPEGATVEAIGWQHNNIRCAINKILKKKLKLAVEASRTRYVGRAKTGAKGSGTAYRIIETG